MKIVIDTMGADRGPGVVIKGAVDALNDSQATMILAGDKDMIEKELSAYTFDKSRIEILDAKEAVTNDDSPTTVLREKKDSSLARALERTKTDDEVVGMVSAGSTGAVLTGALLKIGRIKGVIRPTLAPLIPGGGKTPFTVVDGGANMDCKPEYYAQFAVMGSLFIRAMYDIEAPRVALVSVGTEDKKGDEKSKAAFEILKGLPEGTINFCGNMESREAMSGDYEVLVCDGFVGNVLIKSIEGTAMYVMKSLKNEIMSSTAAKFGALFMKKVFTNLKGKMDYSKIGGAAFLGVQKLVVKTHGSSKADTVRASINQVVKMAERDLIAKIKREFEAAPATNE